MVNICTIYCNDVTLDKFTAACSLDLPIAQDGSLCNEFLYDAAAWYSAREL